MRALLGLLTVLGLAVASSGTSIPSLASGGGQIVQLGYAAYRGNDSSPAGDGDTTVTFFGGIRYAEAPLGDLRFRAPVQIDERVQNGGSVDVQDAMTYGLPCLQQPANSSVESEDCLTLNVWKPSWAKPGDNLPVVVYIFGGGFYYGNPAGFPLYDWVHQSQNVIGVSMNYRLNLFGFLGSHFVQEDGDLNVGLLDQRAAIEWVQRHISQFGGDGSKITISGESAGGASVMLQVTAYGGTKGAPFQSAIAQSIGYGPVLFPYEYEAYFENVTGIAGCPLDSTSMSCLRNTSLDLLIEAINANPDDTWAPIIDGTFLPDLASKLIPEHRFTKVNFIGGHCTNDGRTFAGKNTSVITAADVVTDIEKRYHHLSNETIAAMLEFYPDPSIPGSPYATEYDRAATIQQDIEFGCIDWYLANHSYVRGVENSYLFRFNTPDTVLLKASPYLGVMHTSDIYYLFDGTNSAPNAGFTFAGFNATEKLVSEEIIAYWTSFTRSGNPTMYKESYSPTWTNFGTHKRVVMTEDYTGESGGTWSTLEDVTQDYVDRCMFWMVRGNETRV
ncbi:alpha/beta-hydrolase [Calocera viscosa TUFC12733]|uniref:Carboxylic ester hydrolase n=1 Tax=Calocera viscosa (strain TUFC12733) TaxID=1330018 RepID=A0A167L6M6_CALVF|nr:alpha/beta-hydrolase [Calocera viscosa TUFC12733]